MTPALFKSHLEFDKKQIRQRREKNIALKKHVAEVTKKLQQENDKILQTTLDKHSHLTKENVRLLQIPSGYSKLAPASKTRVEKYIEHVNSIIEEAGTFSSASEVVYDQHHDAHGKMLQVEKRLNKTPALRDISDRICTMCKGGCCTKGGEHAYLSVFTLRTYMDANPDLTAEMLRELYLSHISSQSIEGSCINHSNTGCALPRELRSAICNGYYCDALKAYQKTDKQEEGAVLVVQRAYTNWNWSEPDVSNEVVNVSLVDVQIK